MGIRFSEGAQTDIDFLSMNMWSMRDVALRTEVRLPGGVQSSLRVDARGNIVGEVRNTTRFTLLRPALVAGRNTLRLPDIPPGATVSVYLKPGPDTLNFNNTPIWTQVYGQPRMGTGSRSGVVRISISGKGSFPPFISNGPCCGPPPPQENNVDDRIRNAVTRLPDAQAAAAIAEVTFAAWTDQPLGAITVDGAAPQRRDLTMLITPLSVNLPVGPFTLHTGTLGAHLTEVVPAQTEDSCCGPSILPVYIGSGGSATFQFDIPRAGHVHFRRLSLLVTAGGADGTAIGSVYNWHTSHWDHVNLGSGEARLITPNRYVSATGRLLVNLHANDQSGDIKISNPYHDLQITGTGWVDSGGNHA